ncbi:MAG: 2-succinyl-5-enolpyruvyl-6-hydroxy-3-cyclohexene-1-carboxylic-acid synthase [Paramuribaculum sp.]|nr:2-succinyl-5-enolpyruvyl-6-hydroxy-3-cyclohexene-1-carboxylic-acid synthase [Paramuribaculum sp.]
MHYQAEILADLLSAHGVTDVFVSPGSRNAPLIQAVASRDDLKVHVTVPDERSAAFVALGFASVSSRPVALICTSGTALLDYAPAVAEAFYRNIPLIVVSADRPRAWIDQCDSQTIVQPSALAAVVKRSYDVGPCSHDLAEASWFVDRAINDALIEAMTPPLGPVHINMPVDGFRAPAAYHRPAARIEVLRSRPDLEVSKARELAAMIRPPVRVLVLATVAPPSGTLAKALGKLSGLPNVAVIAEPLANIHGSNIIYNPDAALAAADSDYLDRLVPEVLITVGGPVISARIKKFLRRNPLVRHWDVGFRSSTVDCYNQLTMRAEMDPGYFLRQIASAMQPYLTLDASTYATDWQIGSRKGYSVVNSIVARSPWSDLKAFATMLPLIPKRWNIELSNGTTVRYACILGLSFPHRCEGNRGTSGIDGSTSTAVGAAMAYKGGVTLLITGDMSFLYDMGGLAVATAPDSLKIIVLDNSGGGIFRSIPATRSLSVMPEMLAMNGLDVPVGSLAEGFGFEYFEAADEKSLRAVWREFEAAPRKAILHISTPPEASAAAYASLFDHFSIVPK